MGNPRVFFDITIAGHKMGRIVMELNAKVAPKTVENFRCLCTGEKGTSDVGKRLHYRGTNFHRVIPEFVAQGGDIHENNGTMGESIYGGKFADESFEMKHSGAGVLSMANSGPNTNASQFFICLGPAPWLDRVHVAFGHVVSGMEVLKEIEQSGTLEGMPRKQIVISNCGQL